MIQRIQSIYLLVVILLSGVLLFFVKINSFATESKVTLVQLMEGKDFFQIVIAVLFLTIAFVALTSLLLYKKRMIQILLNRMNMILNLILFGLLIFNLLKVSGAWQHALKGIEFWVPLGSIVFLFLANRAIQKDENLVKSVDRIR